MGTIAAKRILDKCAFLLHDIANIRWTRAELLSWLNDGQRQIVVIAPASTNTTENVNLVSGARQTLPTGGWLLLEVNCNVEATGLGRTVRLVSKELLEGFNPNWRKATPTKEATNYIYSLQDQQVYWVYPPNNGTGVLQINYSKNPTDATTEDATISVLDIYETILVDYIMYRACSKDADYAPGLNLAAGYWSAFTAGLNLKTKAEEENNPNLDLAATNKDFTRRGVDS
jgi:hypothetical protein